jgi:hypothetical protein
MSLTITEALAEIKTIGKRIEKKRQFVNSFLYRQDAFRDPLEAQGGSRAAIIAERQSITDLEERVVILRRAIQQANERTVVTVGGNARTVADWLVWRREISAGQTAFINTLRSNINSVRAASLQKGFALKQPGDQATAGNDVVMNVDERALAQESEALEALLGALDGQLSLKNATVTVEA